MNVSLSGQGEVVPFWNLFQNLPKRFPDEFLLLKSPSSNQWIEKVCISLSPLSLPLLLDPSLPPWRLPLCSWMSCPIEHTSLRFPSRVRHSEGRTQVSGRPGNTTLFFIIFSWLYSHLTAYKTLQKRFPHYGKYPTSQKLTLEESRRMLLWGIRLHLPTMDSCIPGREISSSKILAGMRTRGTAEREWRKAGQ